MRLPEYSEVNGKRYKINTDFRTAIECNEIAIDTTIDDEERALAIIFKLYGDEGLKDYNNHTELLKLAQKYLSCGKELKNEDTPDMDYVEDMDYIEASFMSDYQIDLANTNMHWWKFNNLINGLSNSEMGNCCVLNRIRNLRNCDPREISDTKERQKLIKAKQQVALKKYQKPKKLPTDKQKENAMEFLEALGIRKE